MIAAANQHFNVVATLLNAGAEPNRCNALGRTALMFAAGYGNACIVEVLLDHGADPALNKSADPSALSAAAERGHESIVNLLLRAGASPNSLTAISARPFIMRNSPAMARSRASCARMREIVEALAVHGVNVDYSLK